MKKSILDIDIIAVCQSACGSAGITANGIWLYAGGAKYNKTFNLHKRLLKARKFGLTANPHLRKTNVRRSFYYDTKRKSTRNF